MDALRAELAAAGGAGAGAASTARLRELVQEALRRGREELGMRRSGYGDPVTVVVAACARDLVAALPAASELRADPSAAGERTWLLAAAAVAALVELAEPGPPATPADLSLRVATLPGGFLAVGVPHGGAAPAPGELDELVPLAFEEHARDIDRLRARALAVPPGILEDAPERLTAPIGASHPLRVAEAVARLGGRPADPASVAALEERVLALVARDDGAVARPHRDPDPARRIARRILQRLDGMGKWGGYHTEFAHLARGFAGNERALAQEVGEALLACGLLAEKPSVGQRHVYLDPRRAGEIHRLIDTGETPPGLALPAV